MEIFSLLTDYLNWMNSIDSTKYQNALIEKWLQRYAPKAYPKLKEIKEKENLMWKDVNYFLMHNEIPHAVYCKICGKQIHLEKFGIGFKTYCSIKCMANSPEIIAKKEKTNNERYGGTLLGSPILKEKIFKKLKKQYNIPQETILTNVAQIEEIKKKQEQTCTERYGVPKPLMAKIFKDKSSATCFANYGVKWPMQLEAIREKSKETCLKKYGVSNPNKLATQRIKAYQTKRAHGLLSKSNQEQELYETILKDYPDAIQSDWHILNGSELDIVIPSKKIAIEFNGIYWHNIRYKKEQDCHLSKTLQCDKLGYKLIYIWEDEWHNNKEKTYSELKQIIDNTYDISLYKLNETQYRLPIDKFGLNPPQNYKLITYEIPEKVIKIGQYRKSEREQICWNCGYQIIEKI